jgi:long-chain acyl-CoA synthetase
MIAPTVGGDAMNTILEQESNDFLKAHNCDSKIVKGYGMTEVTGGVAGTVEANNEIGSVGIPFVKQTISVFEPDTENELVSNQEGEICITGPNTMLGYFNNPEATNLMLKKHSDGKVWVHTGDIGHITENGNIFIVDRLKRMMIRYDGFKVFPSLIEKVISTHEAVESCKVVSIADSEHSQGKLPKAHIVLKDEYKDYTEQIQEQLILLCSEQLPEYCQPVDYKFRDKLPLTPIGKVDYISLEAEDCHIKNKQPINVLKKKL